jgi:hypothetical protein
MYNDNNIIYIISFLFEVKFMPPKKFFSVKNDNSDSISTSLSTSTSKLTVKSFSEFKLAVLKKRMKPISVPENEGYEIENGLPDMKRDINLKLVYYLNENQIRQVFYYYSFLLFFIIMFLVVCNKLRILGVEKSFCIY